MILSSEYDECVRFAEFLTIKGILFSHIAQETFTKSWGVKMKNKRMGVMPGVPDYIMVIGKTLCFVEMKRIKKFTISDEQKKWIEALNKTSAVAKICHGFDEAVEFVNQTIQKNRNN